MINKEGSKNTFFVTLFLVLLLIGSSIFGTFFYLSKKEKTQQAEYLYREAIKAWQGGNKSKAERYIAAAIKKNDLAQYYYTAYRFLAYQNKVGLSEFYIKAAADKDQKNSLYQYNAARYIEGIDTQKAYGYLTRALKLEPNNCLYLLMESNMLETMGLREKAIKSLNKCLNKDPHYEMAWHNLAFLNSFEDRKNGVEILEKGLEKNPQSNYLWYQKALFEKDAGLTSAAIASLEKSIDINPDQGKDAANLIYQLSGKAYQGKHQKIIQGLMQKLPFKYRANHIYLYAFVEGVPGWFLLDTGASTSIVYERFLRKNRMKLKSYHSMRVFESVQGIFAMPLTHVNIKLGEFNLADVEVGILDSESRDESDGIIGQNILGNYSLEVNHSEGFVKLIKL